MTTPAQRTQALPGNFFAALEDQITALTKAGKDVIRLDIGSPDLPPDPSIIDTLTNAARRSDYHGYQPHLGPLALRQAWADHYQRQHGVELNPVHEILPLLGSKEGIFNLLMAWINPGEVVLIPDPGYMTYSRGTVFAGGEPYLVPLLVENGYLPDLDAIPTTVLHNARMLWLNYPNNPTGAVADTDFFERAVAFAVQNNLLLCHDAAYARVCYDGYQAPSILEVPGASRVAVEFNSLSKSHSMPGWRVGAVVGCQAALKALYRLKTNLDSGHFKPVLEAAVAALQGDQTWTLQRNQVYQERRDLVIAGLRKKGVNISPPKGAIYIWCRVPAGWSSLDFVSSVLETSLVSLTPGTVFGPSGEGYIRIALTVPDKRINEALLRLPHWDGFRSP